MNYSTEELVKMVYALGEAHGNCLLAARIYKANNPNLQRFPRTDCFENARERFEQTANANYEKTTRRHENCNEDNQITVLASVIENASTSSRKISNEIGVSKSSVNRILKKSKFHPYHITHHQSLSPQDFQNRLRFCRWAIDKVNENPNFFLNVLFTDESSFSNTVKPNRRNFHHYADHNPRILRQIDHQHRFKVNVWAGIYGDHIVGPYFFEGNLNANMYLHFLRNEFHELQRHIPPDDLVRQWFQHDGAPPHSTLTVREHLNELYPNKWLGRGGPFPWPSRSPDLTSLDFFMWKYIKERIYEVPPTDIEDLKLRIRNEFLTVTPQMLRNVHRNFLRRIVLCIENNGGHFEHLL